MQRLRRFFICRCQCPFGVVDNFQMRIIGKRSGHRIRFHMTFNLGLIIAGVAGILPPATSAMLHNASTISIGLKDMTPLPAAKDPKLLPGGSPLLTEEA